MSMCPPKIMEIKSKQNRFNVDEQNKFIMKTNIVMNVLISLKIYHTIEWLDYWYL